tara:strand:+ start:3498 stop:3962 length:465 start_codon:yes stop_codon:yes gene_type:complete
MAVYKIDGFGTRNQTDGSGFDANHSTRKKFVRLFASGTITKGQAVAIDFATSTNGLGNHVLPCAIGTENVSIAMGIAMGAASAGDLVRVQVQGINTIVSLDDLNDVVGQPLAAGAGAGELTLSVVASLPVAILVAEGTASTHDSTVYLLNPLNL